MMTPSKPLIAILAIASLLPTFAQVQAQDQSCKDVVLKIRNHEIQGNKMSDIEYFISGRSDGTEWAAERDARTRSCEVWSRSLDQAGIEHTQITIRYQVPNWTGWTRNRNTVIAWKVCNDTDASGGDSRSGWTFPSCN